MTDNSNLAALVDELSRKIDDLTEKLKWGDIEHRVTLTGDGPDKAKATCRCGWSDTYSVNKSGDFPALADKARREHKAEHDEALARKRAHVFTRTITHKEEPCGAVSGDIRTDCSCGAGSRVLFGKRDNPLKPVVQSNDAERMIRSYEEFHKVSRGSRA